MGLVLMLPRREHPRTGFHRGLGRWAAPSLSCAQEEIWMSAARRILSPSERRGRPTSEDRQGRRQWFRVWRKREAAHSHACDLASSVIRHLAKMLTASKLDTGRLAAAFPTLYQWLAVVPGEGFEPPTFGLQNRCTTTVLTRQINDLAVAPVERKVEHVQLLPLRAARCSRFMAPSANVESGRT